MAQLKLVPLRNKHRQVIAHAKVDVEDYEEVIKYNWHLNNTYAKGVVDKKDIHMHAFILGKAPKGHVIDHINGDPLDNRRFNLRFATHSQNSQNKAKLEGSTSSYKGVSLHPESKKWTAWSSTTYLGSFEDQEEAAKKYDTYAFIKYGPHANTNDLVKYEDVKDIPIESLLCKREARDLPKCIYPKRDTFEVKTYHKNQVFRCVAKTLEEAIEKLAELKITVEKIKIEEVAQHAAMMIQRDSDGYAIVPIVNRKRETVKHARVSDEDWHRCMKYKWSMTTGGYCQAYAEGKLSKMHRFIIDAPDDKIVDHIDNDRLNNARDNLRLCDHRTNNHNKAKKTNATSQYAGVYSSGKAWIAEIRKDGVRYMLGRFDTELEAARTYNLKATEMYGSHANLNAIGA